MRQRRIKNLDEKLEAFSDITIADTQKTRGMWQEICNGRVFVEIGAGKGSFVSQLARENPDDLFVAIEGNRSAVLHAMEKTVEAEARNVRFVTEYIRDVRDIFAEEEVSGIFLNFSDPWPKARHEKRRLTYGSRVREYVQVLGPGGFIEFKTDNDALFEYSLAQFAEDDKLEIELCVRDLHKRYLVGGRSEDKLVSDERGEAAYESRHIFGTNRSGDIIMTEYESKFTRQGKNINFLRAVKKGE